MSHLLYYWRGDNYRTDLDFGVGYHLNQSSAVLHRIDYGESLWAFTRRRDGVYVMAAHLICAAKTLNPKSFRYGRYRVWGHLTSSRYFGTGEQPDITRLIRSLSIRAAGDALGGAFQGHAAVRVIEPADHQTLLSYCHALPLEPRPRLVPEERLEALLLAGDAKAVERLVKEEGAGLADRRRVYLYTAAARRNQKLCEDLRERYDGRCQVTGFDPRRECGIDLCEAHHIRWLSRGGDDAVANMVLLAPNVDRALHRLDAPFDWDQMAFVIPAGRLSLQISHHRISAG